MSDLTGQTLARRYRIDAFLGRGGMADVYKAWDTRRSAYLALKILHGDLAEDKVFVRRFRREAQTLSRLQHPNIVRFYGLEQDGDLVFMLMDFVEGTTLRKEIATTKGPFSAKRILEIMRPLCAALYYAHGSGFVHCDVKPANVLIDPSGRVLVSDFGIARMTEAATVTLAGAGTPAYMSPEQVRGEEPDPRTDIYSLGVVLFQMVTGGEYPFSGEDTTVKGSTQEKIRWQQVNMPAPSPRIYNRTIQPAMEQVIMRCLEKPAARRFSTTNELLVALDAALAERKQVTTVPILAAREAPSRKEGMPPPQPVRTVPKPAPAPRTPSAALHLSRKARAGLIVGLGVLGLVILIAIMGAGLSSSATLAKPQALRSAAPYFTTNRDGHAEIYRLENGAPTRVTTTVGGESWSPFVTLTGTIYFTSNRDGHAEIYRLENGAPTRVTTTPVGDSWSPFVTLTGTIYFTTNRDGHAEIYRLENGLPTRVTNTVGGGSWSPFVTTTGTIYFTTDRDGHAEIYRLENGVPSRVTDTATGQSWSPFVTTPGTIYFTTDRDGHAEIYRLENGAPTRVTTTAQGASWSPFVTATGTIYFTTNRDGHAEIYRLENGKPTRVTNTGQGESWLSTPNGGLMVAARNNAQAVSSPPAKVIPTAVLGATRSASSAPTPISSDGCVRWDTVGVNMSGSVVCVYGEITDVVTSRQIATRYRFSSQPNTFFLYSVSYQYYDPATGKYLGRGTCVSITGEVQTLEGVPFIDIESSQDFAFRTSCQ